MWVIFAAEITCVDFYYTWGFTTENATLAFQRCIFMCGEWSSQDWRSVARYVGNPKKN